MSTDGANMGVLPNRALKTILGGAKQPEAKERLTPEKMREKIMVQLDNYDDIVGVDGVGVDGDAYENTTLWLAKQFLLLLDEGFIGNTGMLYEEMKKRNGPKNYDFTGFMVGYANNVARYCAGKSSQPNPAILEID